MVIDVSEAGPVEAGSAGLTLTCTVTEVISGLTNMPTAHWMGPSGPVTSEDDIIMTETFINDTTVTVTLAFSSLHTSHAGLYTCQGTYHPGLESTSEINSGSPNPSIEEWASIIVTGVLMTADTDCSVAISTLCERKCSPTQPPTADSSIVNTPAIVGVVAVVVALTIVIIVVITAVILMKIHRRKVPNGKAKK